MEKILSFACDKLDCYLDEIKSDRRGDVSRKRRIIILVLSYCGASLQYISKLIDKNLSSVREAFNKSTKEEKKEAFALIDEYIIWVKKWKN